MSEPTEKHLESIKGYVEHLAYIVLLFALLVALFSALAALKQGSANKLLTEQNEILKQILHYQEQSK